MDIKIGIIGFGSMGGMLVNKFAESILILNKNIYVSNRNRDKMYSISKMYPSINICISNNEVVRNSDVIFICTKPLELKNVIEEVKDNIISDKHIVSINGSIMLENMQYICKAKISKVIPSLTAEINQSISLVCHNKFVTKNDKQKLENLLNIFGEVFEIPEDELGMGAELTSCMPGFIASMFEIIINSAKNHTSLSDDLVNKMLLKTVYGTVKLLLERNMSFSEMVARVATKGGITEEGTKVLKEQFPEVCDELFARTLEKREATQSKIINQFTGKY